MGSGPGPNRQPISWARAPSAAMIQVKRGVGSAEQVMNSQGWMEEQSVCSELEGAHSSKLIMRNNRSVVSPPPGGGSARANHTASDAACRQSRRMAPPVTPVSSLYTAIVISDSDDARDLQEDGASSSE